MTLRPGVRIGPYELESLVGDNGLGDVWKARDVMTGRATALRILPAAPPGDPERFARFDRDIRVLASLNHPNIAAVHGIVDAGDTRALAVAWVAGPSLVERLRGGAPPINEAVYIAAQVADAVGAAHDRAVVHGNLQPRNITVSSDLSVKVLDLGLNTLFEPEIPDLSDVLPSRLARAVSVIIGTAAYMSPEQVRGAPADTRTDVWAFGCVLFEMLTGRAAFGATDLAETFALVLGAEPEWTRIPASTPAAFVLMLQTCLKKDAGARRQDLSGLSIELEEIIQQQGAHEAVLRDSLFEQEFRSLKRRVKDRVPQSLELDEDDLVQQTITDAFRRIQGLEPPPARAMGAYLRQVVMNRIRDEVRRQSRARLTGEPDEERNEFPIGPEMKERYEAALEQLSERDRELIQARLEQGLSYEQVALLVGLPSVEAARIAVMRAIKRLAEKMKNPPGE
jgi:RNA polymerase sigma factor (sigma-70 family)